MNNRAHAAAMITFAALLSSHATAGVDELWVAQYNGALNRSDSGNAMTIASDGSVYVAGSTVVPSTNGGTTSRGLLLKYDADGTLEWSREYIADAHPNASASMTHVRLAPDGSVVVGLTTNGASDFALAKYAPDGTQQWSDVYDAASMFVTAPSDLEIDAAGNIYLTGDIGRFDKSIGEMVTLCPVLKYAPDGTRQWLVEYDGPEHLGADGEAIAVSHDGTVYVAGGVNEAASAGQFAISAFDSMGQFLWMYSDGYAGSFCFDRAREIGLDPKTGSIIATGSFGGNTAAGPDVATVRVSPSGQLEWTKLYDGPYASAFGYSEDVARQMVVDSAGNATVVAASQVNAADFDILVLSYDADGVVRWSDTIAGDALKNDWSRAIAINDDDHVLIGGQLALAGGIRHAFMANYAPTGEQTAFVEFEDQELALGAEGVAFGPDGTFGLTGETFSFENSDVVTVLYGSATVAPGDVNGDGVVNVADLLAVIGAWGVCPPAPQGCPADLNADGQVNVADLLFVISNWG